jgi:tetratricopeptide (TPR) repeat protein
MSLINKMLKDLEKRDAFLKESQDTVLDGLYSAYDLELEHKRKWCSSSSALFVTFMIISITALSYYFYTNNVTNINPIVTQTVQQTSVSIIKSNLGENELSVSANYIDRNRQARFLKLDSNLFTEQTVPGDELSGSVSLIRIDKIFFDSNEEGITLVMKITEEVDYLVYGLNNPNRIVIEVNNAELGFIFEELKPVDPIVAIRYSINEDNRFKLVLETDEPLNIRKTTSSNDNDLVIVMMDYQAPNRVVEKDGDKVLDGIIDSIVDKQVEFEKETVYKGELVKTPVSQDVNAYAEKLFRQGYRDYKNGDISKSLKRLNMALDQDAAHINARSTLATILSRQGHIELAYSVLNEGLIQYPEQVEWTKVYARILLNEGKTLEANKLLAKNSPILSNNTEYYALKAAVLQKLNDHTESAKIYRDLLQINPSKLIWWLGLGISLESLKRYDDALYAYQKASSNKSLASESIKFINQRITMLSDLIKDESS